MVQEADVATVLPDLRAVYRATLPAVFGYLLLHTGGDRPLAEDLTAETYLNATRRFRQGRGDEVTVAWLKTVAKRRLIDHWRRQASLRRRALRLRNEVAVSGQSTEVSDAERHDVYAALSKLRPDHRLVLLLRHFDGLPLREIAEQMGRSEKAAESLLARAKEAFKHAYEEGDHA